MSVPAGSNFRIDSLITFDIAIEGIDTLGSQPAIHVLNAMSQKVERILLATEAECRRLGFIK